MSKLIQKGNTKLVDMVMFNLPANQLICGRECKGCYAIAEQKRYPTVLPARTLRYEATLQPDFVSRVNAEITALKKDPKYFRIHASGDFYSQLYVDNWVHIVKKNPNIQFYAYTKRKKHFDFTVLESQSNCVIIDSFHFGRLNYGPLDKAPTGAFICPHQKGSNVVCGKTCNYCMTKTAQYNSVYFKQH